MFERTPSLRVAIRSFAQLIMWVAAGVFAAAAHAADGPAAAAAIPSAAEVADLLRREPISIENWPDWRKRLLDWSGDLSGRTDRAYDVAADFVAAQATPAGELPPPLADDAYAWYLFARTHLKRGTVDEVVTSAKLMERDTRRSIALDPQFARAHRNLALALLIQTHPGDRVSEQAVEAEREMDLALKLDPSLTRKSIPAYAALSRGEFAQAEPLYREANAEQPESVGNALGLATCILQNQQHAGPRAQEIAPLVARHSDNGLLACLHGLALAMDGDARAGVAEFERARTLGVEPAEVFSPELVKAVEAEARPGLLEILKWGGIGFVAIYAFVMAAMALAGFILAQWTRGAEALRLLGDQPLEVVAGGQVERTGGEPWLARLYAICLVFGLILFYVSLPFVTVGLFAATLGALWLVVQMGRIPIKLLIIIIVVGLGMTWAVLKSMFARAGTGSFGLKRSEQDSPKLFATLREVARRVDTTPVDEVYVAPGAEIGVHQEGRGPWGIFGTKRRVLTLGLSTLRSLTISELKSILAHEYAHFSHSDTFYSRFIHRVDLSIHTALRGMGAAGGKLNYVNPFFWFLVLYYRAYSMLSAGFSRSREFLADRMACSLYGSDVFAGALTKVATDGPLFEMTMYETVASLLSENKAFDNMYEAFAGYKQGDDSLPHREKIREDLENERPSLFATHPTHRERLAASQSFPPGRNLDDTPAIQLFEDPDALEKELTEFLTGAIHYAQQQAQAAAAAQSE
jgi:Zn-dependent protease with chaperone function